MKNQDKSILAFSSKNAQFSIFYPPVQPLLQYIQAHLTNNWILRSPPKCPVLSAKEPSEPPQRMASCITTEPPLLATDRSIILQWSIHWTITDRSVITQLTVPLQSNRPFHCIPPHLQPLFPSYFVAISPLISQKIATATRPLREFFKNRPLLI